jgi:hypothetical protein
VYLEHAYGGKYQNAPVNFSVGASAEYQIPLSEYSVYSSVDISRANSVVVEMESNYIIDFYAALHSLVQPYPSSVTLVLRVNSVANYYSAVTANVDAYGNITLIGQAMIHLNYGDVVDMAIISPTSTQFELLDNVSARLYVHSLDDTYYYYSSVTESGEYNHLARVLRIPDNRS